MRTLATGLFIAIIVFASIAQASQERKVLEADTPGTTIAGNTFIAPAGWTLYTKGAATIIEAPEGDSRIVLVERS